MFTGAITVNGPERLGNIQVPNRDSYIRAIMLELSRIASHILWFGPLWQILEHRPPSFIFFDNEN
ncbi:NAD(P)H-quinone oxidoreductase subunit h chloroplastic [Phtheirospermum japonicum]|uniref:NAD(P)H-quinone oxidoreductase subunit h chloroplastic n=1 Tax=Phtheirospermum japonicum TaxID=374723 RepID=A0A830CJB0_9LAMI|nr:NAD(P)H-quinone oxidoreductase subunit h chloroplastic [Phtheirospermum japonicum]